MQLIATRFGTFAAALALAIMLPAVPAQAAELVMFERAGCAWCARWDREVAPAYGKTAEGQRAPLRRHNLDTGQPQDLKLNAPVRYTPTFVLVDQGREIGRITGYIDNGMFWGILTPMIDKLADASPGASKSTREASREQ